MAMPSAGPFAPMPGVFSQGFTTPQAGGGMFGGGKLGIGQAIVAALNGYLAAMGNPAGLANMRMLQEAAQYKRDRADKAAERQQEMQDAMSLYGAKRDYDIAHPLPQQPDEITRHMIAAGIDPNSPQGKAMYAASLDPVVMTPQGPMTRSQLLGASAAGQPAPAGVTFTPIGGPTPQASGGFPGY